MIAVILSYSTGQGRRFHRYLHFPSDPSEFWQAWKIRWRNWRFLPWFCFGTCLSFDYFDLHSQHPTWCYAWRRHCVQGIPWGERVWHLQVGSSRIMVGSVVNISRRMGLRDSVSDIEVGDGNNDEKDNKVSAESVETHALAWIPFSSHPQLFQAASSFCRIL